MSGMPALSFFIDDEDLALLLARLNADPEIAFIVPDVLPGTESAVIRRASTWSRLHLINPFRDGIRDELKTQQAKDTQWKAVRTVDALRDGLNSLWHVPAGSLPLIKVDLGPQRWWCSFRRFPTHGPDGADRRVLARGATLGFGWSSGRDTGHTPNGSVPACTRRIFSG